MIQFRSYDPPQNAYVDLGFRVAFYAPAPGGGDSA